MPNWCSNTLMVTHVDTAMIDRVEQALLAGKLFEEFVPIGEWDYGTAVDMWGTKWDINDGDVIDRNENTITVGFMTAWSPPINFYDELLAQGFEVHAEYFEPGMSFVGQYINGIDEDYSFEDATSPDEIPPEIPEELIENWGIRDMLEDFDEEVDDWTSDAD